MQGEGRGEEGSEELLSKITERPRLENQVWPEDSGTHSKAGAL